jgi:hypothetical protein
MGGDAVERRRALDLLGRERKVDPRHFPVHLRGSDVLHPLGDGGDVAARLDVGVDFEAPDAGRNAVPRSPVVRPQASFAAAAATRASLVAGDP